MTSRPRRTAILCAVALATTLVPAAAAATRPVPKACNLISDAKADTMLIQLPGTGAVDGNGPLDIVGGDVATNAKILTVAIRLAAPPAIPTQSPLGAHYIFNLTGAGTDKAVRLDAVLDRFGSHFTYGQQAPATFERALLASDGIDGDAVGVVSGNEIRISVPWARLKPGRFTPGSRLTGLYVGSERWVGAHPSSSQRTAVGQLYADSATTPKSYVAGTPSCVPIGR